MKIEIASRLKPYSHTPGAACLIPGTHSKIEAYPTLLKIASHEIALPFTGPVRNFTLEQDLERNCVWVFGQAKEGFYRLKVTASEAGFIICADKPKGLLNSQNQIHLPEKIPFYLPSVWERLSLGGHKAQNWDHLWRRMDLREILPVLFGLAQKMPRVKSPTSLPENLESFCLAAFSDILVPRLDEEHQGLKVDLKRDPRLFLEEAFVKIRSLFFRQSGLHLSLLPHCTFDSGRMLSLQASGIGELDLEWTKGMLRRVILRAKQSGEIFLDLPKEIAGYRINRKKQKAQEPLFIEAGKTYYLDRFEK